jgi:fermentation-respiration switch protein FrsA (DUF1100 family)
MKKATFPSEGLTLVGNLFLPQNYQEGTKLPAILITGSWTTVKEQMPNLYAQKLADEGFIAFTFDFRTFGESEGEPRTYESPERKIIDIKHALAFLKTLPEVDTERIYGLGICASAGYMAGAAGEGSPMKKMALVAPWLHNKEIVKLIYGGEEGVTTLIAKGKEAKAKYAQEGISDKVPMASLTDSDAPLFGNWDYYLNPSRGAIKQWANEFNVMSWVEWLTFDGVKVGERISIPTLLVHSKDAAVPMGAEQFYEKLNAKKHFYWTSGTQFDFYDQPQKVDESIKQVVDWLK